MPNKTNEEINKYSVAWAESKAKSCKLCQRKRPNFCKRHTPKVTIEIVKLYTTEQQTKACMDMLDRLEKEIEEISVDTGMISRGVYLLDLHELIDQFKAKLKEEK
jgi:hypothetical protein